MHDISVLYTSYVTLWPGMGNVVHSHDYWHFSAVFSGRTRDFNGNVSPNHPCCSCEPPGKPHSGMICIEEQKSINVMFFVNDRKLEKQLENFDFRSLSPEAMFIPELQKIADQINRLTPSQEFIDAAFSYYFHLLLDSAQAHNATGPETLSDRCLSFIEQNYSQQLRLEDLADYIGRTKTYTSYLVSTTTGQTVVEHLNAVRVRNACTLLAYSDTPIDLVAESCGFTNIKNFARVFKNIVGTTPTRYRTSHSVGDMTYTGDLNDLNVPYNGLSYTYIPSARKKVHWKTPLEYISQSPNT